MIRLGMCIVAMAFSVSPTLAQTPPIPQPAAQMAPTAADALKARLAELPAILNGGGDYDAYFSPAFRAQVPKEKFVQVTAQLSAAGGKVTGIEQVTPSSPDSATISIGFENGTASARIVVDPAEPHQVTGLLVTGFNARAATLEAVGATIGALPGRTGFVLARLGEGAPRLLVDQNSAQPFGIGSAFKLAILAELIRETNAGTRKWTDLVTLDGSPLPGGTYTQSPKGTQVSLRDLAAKMISISDNSATDILLKTLGRETVESILPLLGIANPAALRPFMSTLEMFKLKGTDHGTLAARYLAADEAGRRAMLDGPIAAEPLSAIDPALFVDGKPVLIDRLEWFESPLDLVHVMDWIRSNTESGAGAEARAILAINPGIGGAAAWRYVGYKGGSEPGVLNMTLLLQGKDGAWYVLTGSWNNPAAAVDLLRFASLIGRAADLAAPKP